MTEPEARMSRAELERRWTAVRAAMNDAGVDVLVTQAEAGPYMGYLRYLADVVPPESSGYTLVFPREGGMTLVRQGQGGDQDLPNDPDGDELRGISRVLTTGYYPSLHYSAPAEGERIVEALRPWSSGTIGILGSQRISMAAADAIRSGLPSATVVDATDLLDPIIARKSEEEKTHIRALSTVQDAVVSRVFEEIKPGVTQNQVAALAERYVRELGAVHGFTLCASAPLGTPAVPRPGGPDRVIEKGDLLHLLVETDGPSGYFVHLTRTLVFGEVPAALSEEFELALTAQRFVLDSAQQGVSGAELDVRYRDYLGGIGRPYMGSSYCHGHGYDVMQRPVARAEETLFFGPDMNLGVHPTWVWEGAFVWVSSNFLTSSDGIEELHRFPARPTSR